MIRYGKCIRLTRREAERLQRITGFEPVGVKTLGDLDSYVRKCKAYYDDGTRDAAIINHLIDSEVSRCQLAA